MRVPKRFVGILSRVAFRTALVLSIIHDEFKRLKKKVTSFFNKV